MTSGGKARGLQKLKDGEFLVPKFIVVNPLDDLELIRAGVETTFPGTEYFAVRSSAEGEDSDTRSYAGHFYSAIGVPRARIIDEIRNVSASYGSMPGGVIIQEFIASDSAGVLFTKADSDACVINAIEGLCTPVVEGQACDEYICTREGEIIHATTPMKVGTFFVDGSILRRPTNGQALTKERVAEVVAMGMKVEACFGTPQDIEWCFKERALYVLQSRPITRDVVVPEVIHYDSANIAESYSGIVLPLTCSFASMVYETVYTDLLAQSGVPQKELTKHRDIFANLLAFFSGRMYYRMNNWYRMAEFAPGYARNKRNFERMITSNVQTAVRTVIRPSPFFSLAYPFIIAFKVATFDASSRRFKKNVSAHLRDLRERDFSALDYEACRKLFASFNKNLLRRWYITVENDFFVMTFLGLLGKRLPEAELQRAIIFKSKATEQADELAKLSLRMYENPLLAEALENEDVDAFNRALSNLVDIRTALTEYLHEFGGRFANELKLESLGVDEDPVRLLRILKAYRTYAPSKERVEPPRTKKFLTRRLLRAFKKYAGRREEFRLLRSNTFAMARRLFKRMGTLLGVRGVLEHADDVFYLTLTELLEGETAGSTTLRENVARRKREYASYTDVVLPPHFSSTDGAPPQEAGSVQAKDTEGTLRCRPASPGVVKGKVRVFEEFSMPQAIDFDILVTKHTDPGWTSLIALSKGLIIEHGGVLSHASIVARELGIPAVIGALGAMNQLKTGDIVTIDGSLGTITRV